MWETGEFDLATALGADQARIGIQVLTLYIPSHDRDGETLDDQERWVRRAAEVLVTLGDGVTIPPAYRGGWRKPDTGETIWEHPVLPYTYVDPGLLLEQVAELRAFLHRMGRETGQGEVAFEFDGEFCRITDFDHRSES